VKKEELIAKMKLKRKEKKKQEKEEEKRKVEERDIPLAKYNYDMSINQKVALIRADITTLELDAIVNAANISLLGGGGIDGAIHRAAGLKLDAECTSLGGAEVGETKVTRGYNLPAKLIFHTVGPRGRHEEDLIKAYSTCLGQLDKHKVKTIAFCGISSGIFGYPLYAASHVALNTVRKWLEDKENRKRVDLIVFCTYLPQELTCYHKLMPLYFPPKGKDTDEVVKILKSFYDTYDPTKDEVIVKEEKDAKEKKKEMKEKALIAASKKEEKKKEESKKEESKKEESKKEESKKEEKKEE